MSVNKRTRSLCHDEIIYFSNQRTDLQTREQNQIKDRTLNEKTNLQIMKQILKKENRS
jgi:hypothetical protein